MVAKLVIPTVILLLAARGQDLPKFMGREVTITEAEVEDDFFPKGPASVCLEGPPQRQCYTAPQEFGRFPTAAVVQLDKDTPALLFSAASGGVSGWSIHFALLRPGTGKSLEDLFGLGEISLSNQSQHTFWNDPAISDAQIFATAMYAFGPDEGHYGEHRYIISAYVRRHSSLLDGVYYYLEDQYMTAKKYDLEAEADILTSEKQEILARLRRVKAERERSAPR
jgi:hypothetical protein